jgi:multiple sugar transport system substrate-binding protein
MDRRDFLRLAGAAVTSAAVGGGCGSGSENAEPAGPATSATGGPGGGARTLRIALLNHFVPAYDTWFDNEYTRRWAEEHDIEVIVDHIPYPQLTARADTEVASQRGHDIFGFFIPPGFEDHVIDHREIVEEVEAKVGKLTPLVERSIVNPKTGKYFAFSDYWSAKPVHYRADLWNAHGSRLRPDSWDDVRRASPGLKAAGHPLGIGMSSDPDSELALLGLLAGYGASVQDEDGNVVLDRRAAVEAVKMGVALFREGMTDEVFGWDAASNNRVLADGRTSMILNPISAMRAVETQNPALAAQIALAPLPSGPVGRLGPPSFMGLYVIWRFAANPEAAKQFLVDLALRAEESFLRSEFYNLPSFPGAVKDLAALLANDSRARPPAKYAFLSDAAQWTRNLGYPGSANPAVAEVAGEYLVSKMFATAARGELSAEEAVKGAHARAKPIFDKWRERGKI